MSAGSAPASATGARRAPGLLAPLARKTSPLLDVPREDARDAHWVTPSLVGEVTYGELTEPGRLRHPVWRGLRPDKSPDEVVWESALSCPSSVSSRGQVEPRCAASRSASLSIAARTRLSILLHSSSRRVSLSPDARGRQVPTISRPDQHGAGPADHRPQTLVPAAVRNDQISRSRACSSRSYGPSSRTSS